MQRPRAAVQNAQPPCKLQLNDYNFLLPAASLMARSTSLALPIDGWRIGLTRPSPLSLSVPYIFPFGIPIPTPSPSSHYYTCLLILIPYGALMNNGESWGLGVTGRAQYRRTCFFFFSFLFFPVALISREEESVERCYFLASIWRWKTLSYNRDPLLSTVRLGDNLHSMISDRFPSPSSLCLVATSCLYPIAAIARRAYNS